jgi:hypothetical protein
MNLKCYDQQQGPIHKLGKCIQENKQVCLFVVFFKKKTKKINKHPITLRKFIRNSPTSLV